MEINIKSTNVFICDDGIAIQLRGGFVQLSHEDKDILFAPHDWYVNRAGYVVYNRMRHGEIDRTVYLQQIVRERLLSVAYDQGMHFDGAQPVLKHRDGDLLNCRRSNLYFKWGRGNTHQPVQEEPVIVQEPVVVQEPKPRFRAKKGQPVAV